VALSHPFSLEKPMTLKDAVEKELHAWMDLHQQLDDSSDPQKEDAVMYAIQRLNAILTEIEELTAPK
jgi:hypothetical protein